MKHRAMLFAMVCLAVTAQAQEWNYKMHHGDVLVYEEANTSEISIIELSGVFSGVDFYIGDPVDSAWVYPYKQWIPPYFVGLTGGCIIDMRFQSIDANGIVYQAGGHDFGDIDMFPTFIPSTDTILLQKKQWSAGPDRTYQYRMYDTIVCGANVRAISFIRERGDTLTEMTVSELFGIVRIRNAYEHWRLSSATVATVHYGFDTRKFAVFPTCAGSEFYYRTTYFNYPNNPPPVLDRYVLRDTLIRGVDYFHPAFMLWHNTGGAPFRVEDGIAYIYTATEERMLDSAMSLGSRTPYGIIVDTGTVKYQGRMRRYIATVPSYNNYTWIEGVGLISNEYREQFWGGYSKSLVYANICGEEYGTPVGIQELPIPAASRIFSAPYPNPVSLSQGAVELATSQTITQPITIAVTDVLGRHVYTQRLNPTGPGTALRIPLRNIGPGLYYLSITGAAINETKKMVVVR